LTQALHTLPWPVRRASACSPLTGADHQIYGTRR
jgi:hypothetical protein